MGRSAYNGGGTIIGRGGKWPSGLDEVPLARCESKATQPAPPSKPKQTEKLKRKAAGKSEKKAKAAPKLNLYSRSLTLTEMRFLARVAKLHASGKATPAAPRQFSARIEKHGTVQAWIAADGDRRRYYCAMVNEAKSKEAMASELADILRPD